MANPIQCVGLTEVFENAQFTENGIKQVDSFYHSLLGRGKIQFRTGFNAHDRNKKMNDDKKKKHFFIVACQQLSYRENGKLIQMQFDTAQQAAKWVLDNRGLKLDSGEIIDELWFTHEIASACIQQVASGGSLEFRAPNGTYSAPVRGKVKAVEQSVTVENPLNGFEIVSSLRGFNR